MNTIVWIIFICSILETISNIFCMIIEDKASNRVWRLLAVVYQALVMIFTFNYIFLK